MPPAIEIEQSIKYKFDFLTLVYESIEEIAAATSLNWQSACFWKYPLHLIFKVCLCCKH